MLKIKVLCVGDLSESFYKSAQQEYLKRLGRYCDITVCQVPDEKAPGNISGAMEEQIKQRECAKMLDKLRPDDLVVALDLSGKELTSPQLAQRLDGYAMLGKSICFVIGGSLGLSKELLARANERLCLSKMTFTHNMARILLLEQLYRGFKINANEPYHK